MTVTESTASKTNNSGYTAEYLRATKTFDSLGLGRRACWEYLEGSTSRYNDITVYSAYVPRLFDQTTYDLFDRYCTTTHAILVKVIEKYLEDPAFRDVFAYSDRIRDLILLPRDYDSVLPLIRIDLFLNEDTLEAKFCEFNADGSSGMNENREINIGVEASEPFKAFAKEHAVQNCVRATFDGWVDEFLRIYDTYRFKVEKPHVAIVDFLDHAVVEEFKVFGKLFEQRGIGFSVFDVRELRFDGEKLVGGNAYWGKSDVPIDAIWRRAISSDVAERWEESQPLIEAVRARKVALIGSFAGHIVHDKQIFRALFDPRVQAILTEEENDFVARTVPFTAFLESDAVDLAEVKRDPAAWIIKPFDSYGSQNVFAGRDFSAEEWSAIVDGHADGADEGRPYLVQRFCTPYATETIPLYGKEADYTAPPRAFNNLSGLYIYNGRFAGVFSRLGPNSIILGAKGGVTAPSMWVDCAPCFPRFQPNGDRSVVEG